MKKPSSRKPSRRQAHRICNPIAKSMAAHMLGRLPKGNCKNYQIGLLSPVDRVSRKLEHRPIQVFPGFAYVPAIQILLLMLCQRKSVLDQNLNVKCVNCKSWSFFHLLKPNHTLPLFLEACRVWMPPSRIILFQRLGDTKKSETSIRNSTCSELRKKVF